MLYLMMDWILPFFSHRFCWFASSFNLSCSISLSHADMKRWAFTLFCPILFVILASMLSLIWWKCNRGGPPWNCATSLYYLLIYSLHVHPTLPLKLMLQLNFNAICWQRLKEIDPCFKLKVGSLLHVKQWDNCWHKRSLLIVDLLSLLSIFI